MTLNRSDSIRQASDDKKRKIPKAGRYFDTLFIPDPARQLSKSSSSYHLILEGITSSGKKTFVKFLQKPDETYATYDPNKLIKSLSDSLSASAKISGANSQRSKPEWPIPTFEAFMADLFRMRHRKLSPNIIVFYDRETEEQVCHGSVELPGFKTNHSAPLGADKLFISTLDPAAKESRELINLLRTLSRLLEEQSKPGKEPTSWGATLTPSILSYGWNSIKYQGNALYNTNASGNFKPLIDQFIADKSKLTAEELKKKLIPAILSRKTHIGSGSDRQSENKLLDAIFSTADSLASTLTKAQNSQPTVRVFHKEVKVDQSVIPLDQAQSELEKAIKQRKQIRGMYRSVSGIELTPEIIRKYEFWSKRLGDSLYSISNRDYEVTANDPDRSITITVNDLINYRVIKAISQINVNCFHNKEGDYHNENLSTTDECPARVDHDMTYDDISYHFKDKNVIERFQRTPSEDTYKYTNDILDCFPIVKNAYYWPTKYSTMSDSKLKFISSLIANYERHLFRENDNKIFQSLALEPFSIFHSYTEFLALMLTPDDLIKALCESPMKPSLTYLDKNTGKTINLMDKLLQGIKARKAELLCIAVNNSGFSNFMECYSEVALELIKADFQDYKQHHFDMFNKHDQNPDPDVDHSYSLAIANSIDLEVIEAEFKRINDCVKGSLIPFEIGGNNSIITQSLKM